MPVERWLDYVMDKPVRQLHADNCGITNEQFQAFVEAHPELEEVSVAWNQQLTDMSCLRTMPESPRWVCVSRDMEQAIASLGEGYGFELQID